MGEADQARGKIGEAGAGDQCFQRFDLFIRQMLTNVRAENVRAGNGLVETILLENRQIVVELVTDGNRLRIPMQCEREIISVPRRAAV